MCSYLGIEQAFKPDWSTHRSHSRTDVCISKEAMQTLVWGCHRKLFFCSTSVQPLVSRFCIWRTWLVKFMLYIVIVLVLSMQSCPTLWDSMDCSPPGSSVHGLSQTRILEWVDISIYTSPASPALAVPPGRHIHLYFVPKASIYFH